MSGDTLRFLEAILPQVGVDRGHTGCIMIVGAALFAGVGAPEVLAQTSGSPTTLSALSVEAKKKAPTKAARKAAPKQMRAVPAPQPAPSAAHAEIGVEYGSYDWRQVQFDVGGPVTTDSRWLYRFVCVVREAGTQVDHVDNDRIFLAPSITITSKAMARR